MTETASVPARTLDRLNPVARLLCALLLALPILITLDWVSSGAMLVLEIVAFRLVGVGFRTLRRLLPVAVLALIAAASMALYGRPGGTVFVRWWLVIISERSLLMALAVGLRVLALALAAVGLLGGVDPTDMADGLAQIVRLPARFVLGTLAGIRLLSLLAEDWRSLGLARRARGLGDHGRLRRFFSMVFALLVLAIRRGTKLATAMEVRGFGAAGRQRTWARESRLGPADAVGLGLTLVIDAVSLTAAVAAGTFWFIWTGVPD
ncbi:MAG: energy-coupling factor transporter transmembrane protein EcfT [Propionibacteriaceae bacterium]|jgi:energy-coupling factor transport system permease protein|nr:energy-coupling factor transporter transmembrane protein EcfT [Propionibacteriaceae bacterium]